MPKDFIVYLPQQNASLYSEFIKQKGVISKITRPEALSPWGIKNSKKVMISRSHLFQNKNYVLKI